MSKAKSSAEQPAEGTQKAPNMAPADAPETEETVDETEAPSGDTVMDMAPDSAPDETAETEDEGQSKDEGGAVIVTIVYVGDADVFRYDPYAFRPGVPAFVPKSLAEELLTFPFERFEVKE